MNVTFFFPFRWMWRKLQVSSGIKDRLIKKRRFSEHEHCITSHPCTRMIATRWAMFVFICFLKLSLRYRSWIFREGRSDSPLNWGSYLNPLRRGHTATGSSMTMGWSLQEATMYRYIFPDWIPQPNFRVTELWSYSLNNETTWKSLANYDLWTSWSK